MDPAAADHRGPLSEAFENVRQDWESDAKHKAFLGLAASLDRLPEAASLYRAEGETDDERATRANTQLASITALALAKLVPMRSERKARPKWLTFLALAITSVMFAVAVYGLRTMLIP